MMSTAFLSAKFTLMKMISQRENWIQGSICTQWCHQECSALKGRDNFVSDNCNNKTCSVKMLFLICSSNPQCLF